MISLEFRLNKNKAYDDRICTLFTTYNDDYSSNRIRRRQNNLILFDATTANILCINIYTHFNVRKYVNLTNRLFGHQMWLSLMCSSNTRILSSVFIAQSYKRNYNQFSRLCVYINILIDLCLCIEHEISNVSKKWWTHNKKTLFYM